MKIYNQIEWIRTDKSAKMTVTYKWFRLAEDEFIKEELKAEIYTNAECESNAKYPFKIEGKKKKCIPLLRTQKYLSSSV